jgi:putative endonuclease
MEKAFYVYILTNKKYGTFYVGMTSDLIKRIWQHKNEVVESFTKEHGLKNLVYFEAHQNAESAIRREKRLKRWDRTWKIELIEKSNPYWVDLYDSLAQ